MRKSLLLLATLVATTFPMAAQRVAFTYQDSTYHQLDTICMELPSDYNMVPILFTSLDTADHRAIASCALLRGSGITITGICAGNCVDGAISAPFDLLANSTYRSFYVDLDIDPAAEGSDALLSLNIGTSADTLDNLGTCLLKVHVVPSNGVASAPAPNSLILYPNPAWGYTTATIATPHNSRANTLRLTDMKGRTILVRQLSADQDKVQIDIRQMARGLYRCTLEQDGKPCSQATLVVK